MGDGTVILDGFNLTGPDRLGDWKQLGQIEGWFSSPSIKDRKVARPHGPGSFKTPVEYDERLITYNGRVASANHGYLHEAAGQLAALGHDGEMQFSVSGHGPTQFAMVELRADGIKPVFETDNYMSFQIQLKAVDPFKYGERRPVEVLRGASATVFHRGTVDAWPRAYVSGNMPDGYTLTLAGQQVSVPMGIPSGATHTIDYRRRRLYVNGSLFMGAFGSSNFRPVPPGRRTTAALSAPSGSGSATFTVYDTYI